MVQFVEGGPNIPEGLLRDHEEGRVIFFCGAGMSRQAKLSAFDELVDECYEELCTERTPEQKDAIAHKRYAEAIGLLEEQLSMDYLAVRHIIARILQEDQESCELDTHRALLKLAKHQNRTRLITTNFDHLFEKAAKKGGTRINYYAPSVTLLNDVRTWDGVMYLHGRMPELSTPGNSPSSRHDLAQLILSSGDFAQAYQIGGQVTHFIQRLLCLRYTICFVGYSMDDVMMRYLVDGNRTISNYSTDKEISPSKLYAFVGTEKTTSTSLGQWRGRSVEHICYNYNKSPNDKREDHTPLHDTLCAWVQNMDMVNKIKIIEDSAPISPISHVSDDSFVGRVLWALKDVSGKPAECFASLTRAPALEWLVTNKSKASVHDTRPEQISLFDGLNMRDHKKVITQLGHWLARHLNDPRVLVWLIGQQHELREEIALCIRTYLRLNSASGSLLSGLEPRTWRYWHLFLGGRILRKLPSGTNTWTHETIGGLCGDVEFLDWQKSLVKHGLTTASKMHLMSLFRPMLVLKLEPKLWETPPLNSHAKSFDDIAFGISCATDYEIGVPYRLKHPLVAEKAWHGTWQKVLPKLLPDFNRLLRDGLDLLHMVGGADDECDLSYMARPSISDWQRDKTRSSWSPPNALDLYITLIRDAWLAKNQKRSEQSKAKADAMQWMQEPYPAFKRLAFFAATQSTSIKPQQALKWLLARGGIWLWSDETKREAIRLIVYLASKLGTADREILEQAILAKPPQFENWDVYLRLARLEEHLPKDLHLGNDAQVRLNMLRKQNPKWNDYPEEDAEFPDRRSIWDAYKLRDEQKYHNTKPNRWL